MVGGAELLHAVKQHRQVLFPRAAAGKDQQAAGVGNPQFGAQVRLDPASAEAVARSALSPLPLEEMRVVSRHFGATLNDLSVTIVDEDSDEDVLVFEPAFNLSDLIEDELIMAQPLVPMHGQCPTVLPTSAGPVIEDGPAKPNPFAVLQQIKKA